MIIICISHESDSGCPIRFGFLLNICRLPGAYTEMSRKPLSTSSVCLVEYIMLLAGGLGVQQDASIHA